MFIEKLYVIFDFSQLKILYAILTTIIEKILLDQAGPGAAKRGFGYESVNRLKTTCGRPGTLVGYPENPAVCIRDVE